MTRRPRLPLRARLSLLYALVFVIAAGALLAFTVVLVNRSIDRASAVNSPAQREYVSKLESSLQQIERDIGKGNADPNTAGKQAAIKRELIEANANSADAVRAGTVNTLLGTSLLTLAVLVPASVVGGWFLARRALRPVRAITAAAQRASENRLHERLDMAGPRDEVTDLADTFDDLLARLEHAFDGQKRFVANASHELRTPLTVARTAIDVTMAKPDRTPAQLERMAGDVHGAVDRAERLVDGLLTLTRSQNLATKAEPVDLATAAQDALDALDGEISAHGLTVRATLDPAATTGDRALIDRLAANLVENAVRHNQSEGWLSVHTGLDGRHVVLMVTNTGAVLDPARVPELFEPFQRANGRAASGERGLGLGLSIVRAVAEAHHAQVSATARPDGGLAVTVRFLL
jgi:signal transduction histidine kinase